MKASDVKVNELDDKKSFPTENNRRLGLETRPSGSGTPSSVVIKDDGALEPGGEETALSVVATFASRDYTLSPREG